VKPEENGIQSTQKDKLNRETVSYASVAEKCLWEQNCRNFVQMPAKQNLGGIAGPMMLSAFVKYVTSHLWRQDSKIKNAVPMSVHIKRMLDGTNDDKQK
jgi:hypothetical protein